MFMVSNVAVKAKGEIVSRSADLLAQQAMAEAAWWMVGIAALQLALAAVSAILIFFAFRESRRASNAATDTSSAAIESNAIARMSNRAWLGVALNEDIIISTVKFDNEKINNECVFVELKIIVKNYGNLPSINISMQVGIYVFESRQHMESLNDSDSVFLTSAGGLTFFGKTLFPLQETNFEKQSVENVNGIVDNNPYTLCLVGKISYFTNGKNCSTLFGCEITLPDGSRLSPEIPLSEYGVLKYRNFWESARI